MARKKVGTVLQSFSERAKKGWETRRFLKEQGFRNLSEANEAGFRSIEELQEFVRREQDERDKQEAIRTQLYEAEIMYQNIEDLIHQYPTKGSIFLGDALASEIRKYGRDAVIMGIKNAPTDMVKMAQDIVYYQTNSDAIHSAIREFFNIITGEIMSAEDSKELGNTMDSMGYGEYDDFY